MEQCMGNRDWVEIKRYILSLIDSVKNEMDSEEISQTLHLLECDEYEMALESVLLDVMSSPVNPELDYDDMMRHVKLLGLDVESVFCDDFFERFEKFYESRMC